MLEENFADILVCKKCKQVGPSSNQSRTISGGKFWNWGLSISWEGWWTDSLEKAIGLKGQELNSAVEGRILGRFIESLSWRWFDGTEQQQQKTPRFSLFSDVAFSTCNLILAGKLNLEWFLFLNYYFMLLFFNSKSTLKSFQAVSEKWMCKGEVALTSNPVSV